MNLERLTIREAHDGLMTKKFSAVELLDACLDKIEQRNKELNALVLVDKEGAKESALAVDAKISAGERVPVLAGIPASIKDLLNTKGVRTTCCSPFLKDFVPPYDASVVAKLKEEGMVMVGKANLDEFACGASTEYSYFGVTRNPYDLERVAGGSSGGSAASVASDMCFYSIGTDTGGSIRQPASFCGVYGFKVTYGRVSRNGITAMASSWDTIGPFAKSVEDTAHIMNAICGRDELDSTTLDVAVPDFTTFLNQDVKGLRVGLPIEYFGEGVEPEVAKIVKEAAYELEKKGAIVKEISLPLTKYALSVYYITMPAELSANLERFDGIRFGSKPKDEPSDLVDYYYKARAQGFGDEIKRRIMIGTYVLSAGYADAYYKKAQRVRTLIIEEFKKAFEDVDVMIAPVSPFPPFKIGQLVDNPLAMYMADVLAIPASAAGLPAFACPVKNTTEGLPVGLQIIGPQFEEGLLFKVASALEKSN